MRLNEDSLITRVLVVLMVAAAVGGAVWTVWIVTAVVFGLTGWLLSSVGGLLERLMDLMESVWGTVTLIALVCGGLVGGLLALAGMTPSDVVGLFARPSGLRARIGRDQA